MTSKQKVYIYVGNHYSIAGLEDYLITLKVSFSRMGIDSTICERIVPDHVNLIFEHFYQIDQLRYIENVKRQYPNTKLVLVMTEVVGAPLGVKTFNPYYGVLPLSFVVFYNVLARAIEGQRITVGAMLPAILLMPLAAAFIFAVEAPRIFSRMIRLRKGKRKSNVLRRLKYFHLRYLRFERIADKFDSILCSHQSIMDSLIPNYGNRKKIFLFYPEFDLEIVKNNYLDPRWSEMRSLAFEVTGTVTPYRMRSIKKVTHFIYDSGLYLWRWSGVQIRSFSSAPEDAKGPQSLPRYVGEKLVSLVKISGHGPAFSLHAPQTRNWSLSSPTRLYRSIAVDVNIPVIVRAANDHPIEKCCLQLDLDYDFFLRLESLHADQHMRSEEFLPKIERYNATVRPINDAAFRDVLTWLASR